MTDNIEELEYKIEELEFQSSFINKKSKVKFNYIKISVLVVLFIVSYLYLIFGSDDLIAIDHKGLALVTNSMTLIREDTIDAVEKAKSTTNHNASGSLDGVEYYDVEIPYTLTCGQIGGMLEGQGTDTYTNKTFSRPSYVSDLHIGDAVMVEFAPHLMTSKFNPQYDPYKVAKIWENEGKCLSEDVPTAALLRGRYLSAIQPYFYSSKDAYWKSEEGVGQYFDVVLTDGTVIPFIVIDINAKVHTNRDTSDSPTSVWPTGKLLMPEYKYLFSGVNGNCLELIGERSSASAFKKFYGLGTTTHIAYYRMYKKKVFD